jgi:truncated hemoglobin YjbI
MGQSKKQYQEWVEHHFPQEIAKEINSAWTEQFEQFVQQLMNTKFRDEPMRSVGESGKEENKDE